MKQFKRLTAIMLAIIVTLTLSVTAMAAGDANEARRGVLQINLLYVDQNGNEHVKSCRWSSQVIFAEDADYSFTFGCVDMDGNASAFVEEQAFIIDRTLPVIQVSYDNNDSPGSYFYREGRTATITVVEHNFSSSEVNLAVSSPDGDTHAPSAWREAGAD